MNRGMGVLLLLCSVACSPMKSAYLTPKTSIIGTTAGAKRLDKDGWEICLSLPSSAANWVVSLGEPFEVIRHDEKGRANYSWVIPPERWRNPEPFKLQVKAAGLDEIVVVPHPTWENVPASGVVIALEIIFLPSKIPRP